MEVWQYSFDLGFPMLTLFQGEGWMANPNDHSATGNVVANDETSDTLDPAEVEKAIEQVRRIFQWPYIVSRIKLWL